MRTQIYCNDRHLNAIFAANSAAGRQHARGRRRRRIVGVFAFARVGRHTEAGPLRLHLDAVVVDGVGKCREHGDDIVNEHVEPKYTRR